MSFIYLYVCIVIYNIIINLVMLFLWTKLSVTMFNYVNAIIIKVE